MSGGLKRRKCCGEENDSETDMSCSLPLSLDINVHCFDLGSKNTETGKKITAEFIKLLSEGKEALHDRQTVVSDFQFLRENIETL